MNKTILTAVVAAMGLIAPGTTIAQMSAEDEDFNPLEHMNGCVPNDTTCFSARWPRVLKWTELVVTAPELADVHFSPDILQLGGATTAGRSEMMRETLFASFMNRLLERSRTDLAFLVAERALESPVHTPIGQVSRAEWLVGSAMNAAASRDFPTSIRWNKMARDYLAPFAQHPRFCAPYVSTLNSLGQRYTQVNSLEDGASVVVKGLEASRACFGEEHHNFIAMQASRLLRQGLPEEALEIIRRAMDYGFAPNSKYPDESGRRMALRSVMAEAYFEIGDIDLGLKVKNDVFAQRVEMFNLKRTPLDARAALATGTSLIERLIQVRQFQQANAVLKKCTEIADSANIPSILLTHAKLSLEAQSGDAERAIPQLSALADQMRSSLGADSLDEGVFLSQLALAASRVVDAPRAINAADRALEILRKQGSRRGLALWSDIQQRRNASRALIRLLSVYLPPDQQTVVLEGPEALKRVEQAFAAFQLLRAHPTQLISEARLQSSGLSDANKELARRWLRLKLDLEAAEIDASVASDLATGSVPPEGLAGRLSQLREKIDQTWEALSRSKATERLLDASQPVSLIRVQELLQSDEVFVTSADAQYDGFVWVIRKSRVCFHRIASMQQLVDNGAIVRRALRPKEGESFASLLARPFPVGAAYGLYTELIKPCEALLEGVQHVYYVPTTSLQDIPPSVLVMAPPAADNLMPIQARSSAWWLRRFATSVLPSESLLVSVGDGARRTGLSLKPFIGFADPDLQAGTAGVDEARLRAGLAGERPLTIEQVRAMKKLPQTQVELRALAGALSAPASSVRLGADATVESVKQSRLSQYRSIAFSTHAVLAYSPVQAKFPEHALVLPVKDIEGSLVNGLLTAGEIESWTLNADSVFLLACSTGAGAGRAHNTHMAGLVRAFVNAGARKVVFSYWPIDNKWTSYLIGKIAPSAGRGANMAQAMRQAILDGPLSASADAIQWAHPAFWSSIGILQKPNAVERAFQ